ncbi:hypothetical protein [Billgrantia desiderata]|uniref:hypothetical protein n=1 Tax=Billgrantia desiderata TaxID=52021 RepID=UPI00089EBD2B|nr:hypothetical protein [Halomonas desiderata]SEG34094.1 hypothetical protein SAMN04487953_12430 [Halomonas desiderata]
MPMYELNCADGTDCHCTKTVKVAIDVEGLTEDQLEEIEDEGGTELTKEQVEASQIILDKEALEHLAEYDTVYIRIDVDHTCSPCGSDQTYDDEGNNISAE